MGLKTCMEEANQSMPECTLEGGGQEGGGPTDHPMHACMGSDMNGSRRRHRCVYNTTAIVPSMPSMRSEGWEGAKDGGRAPFYSVSPHLRLQLCGLPLCGGHPADVDLLDHIVAVVLFGGYQDGGAEAALAKHLAPDVVVHGHRANGAIDTGIKG